MDAQKLMFVYEKVHQLLPPRSPTGALPLDPTGGLLSPRPPLQLDPHFSNGSAASDVFSKKGTCGVQWGLEQNPHRSWGIFKHFCVKSNPTVCKATFNCMLQKKMAEQDVLVAPPIIPAALPVPAPINQSTR